MAGRGPRPKDPDRRVRYDSGHAAPTHLDWSPVAQPPLPDTQEWPAETVRWWANWRDSPLSSLFGITDWDFLLDTALLHAALWSGTLSALPELRLRVAKFGATPEDRARLRIEFADADEADEKRRRPSAGQSSRYASVSPLRAVSE